MTHGGEMVMMVVRTENGLLYYIEIELNSRLKRLREKIEEVTHIPKNLQKVIFCHPVAFEEIMESGVPLGLDVKCEFGLN